MDEQTECDLFARLRYFMDDLMPPLALSDYQLNLVREAAKTIPLNRRGDSLRSVAHHLGSEPSDEAVLAAIDHAIVDQRISTFLRDSAAVTRRLAGMS